MPEGVTAGAELTALLEGAAARVEAALPADLGPEVAARMRRYVTDTLERTMHRRPDGSIFVITGDIPAMWLRDSSLQLLPLLAFLRESGEVRDLVRDVLRTQFALIAHDPYANAFNDGPTGAAYHPDDLDRDPHLWERKYEIDSLGLPVDLLWRWWSAGHDDALFTDETHAVLASIVDLWALETRHEADSPYRFVRADMPPSETLARDGLGTPVAETGMTWAAFRPSDDALELGYNIPAQLLAARALDRIARLAVAGWSDSALAARALELRTGILAGVAAHGLLPDGAYAYEVDGLGGAVVMDDGNMPSLLSLPLCADVVPDDPTYLTTRALVLSPANPHYVSGRYARGIGSPHTPPDYVWPIALAVQGLTSPDCAEKVALLRTLVETDAGTGWMHEGFHVDDPALFTRPWFSWANMMFVALALDLAGYQVRGAIPSGVKHA